MVPELSRPLDPAAVYVLLGANGAAVPVPGGEAFWGQPEAVLDAAGRSWMVSEYTFSADWPNWEMHPQADEFVYLLEGDVTLHLELPEGLHLQRVTGRGAVLIPKGVWHTAKASTPCRMLHITLGEGTQSRPVQTGTVPQSS